MKSSTVGWDDPADWWWERAKSLILQHLNKGIWALLALNWHTWQTKEVSTLRVPPLPMPPSRDAIATPLTRSVYTVLYSRSSRRGRIAPRC